MKTKTLLILASSTGLIHAGSPDLEPSLAAPPAPWLKPTIDIRSRYEFADIDGYDTSHALTFRERLGFGTTAWKGLSAYVEGEFSQAVIDDYHGGALGAHPYDPSKSVLADPETNELNQGYLQYDTNDTVIKAGRQKIVYDNSAFIGDVIWRQNQQTYDALSLTNTSVDKLTVHYAYLNQVNRIFGSEADGSSINSADVAASAHLLNASYTGISGLTLGGYAYLMNFANRGNWDNNTLGASAKGKAAGLTWYGELAYQDKAGTAGTDEALYAHATLTKAIGAQSVTLGIEHLDAGFKTPLATLHAFNGFADAFIGGRSEGNHHGLSDLYLSHVTPIIFGMKWTNVIHSFGDDEISTGYGWEYNSVLVKKFDDHFTALAKFAYFEAGEDRFAGKSKLRDTTRFSVEVDYTF